MRVSAGTLDGCSGMRRRTTRASLVRAWESAGLSVVQRMGDAGDRIAVMVLKEGVGGGIGVACVRVWCVCSECSECLCPVSLSNVRVSRSLPSWLARNGAGRRLTDGNNVQQQS